MLETQNLEANIIDNQLDTIAILQSNQGFFPPKNKDPKERKEKVIESVEESKMGIMMFKTSIRNHLHLSSLADNKVNTILSINALIITVAIPLMTSYIQQNILIVIPMSCLLLTSIGSMFFATKATRPIKVFGKTTKQSIINGQSDLFFFGNFCNMEYDEFEEGLEIVIKDNTLMQKSIMIDLFYSGKALGDKFNQLRTSYTLFISGLILSSILFVATLSYTYFTNN